MDQSAPDWAQLHKEFCGIKDYEERLAFYHHHFSVLPFSLPAFDPMLPIFLQDNNQLPGIYEQEKTSGLNLVIFKEQVEGKKFVFDVKPGREQWKLNQFIIDLLTINDPSFQELIEKIQGSGAGKVTKLRELLNASHALINRINQRVSNPYAHNLQKQFLQIFYTGYRDCQLDQVKRFPTKRKLTELFIYAQGILFAKYQLVISQQLSFLQQHEHKLLYRLELCHRLGIIDHLRKRTGCENKVLQLVSELIDEESVVIEKLIGQRRSLSKDS